MLSVIVPVYNASQYLRRCLDSLLAQDVNAYEIICVNDGSIDESNAILAEYEISYPNVIRVLRQPNSGVSAARNNGMSVAKGEVIAFCDSDDYLIPGAYRYLLETYWRDDLDVLKFNSITLDGVALKTWHETNDVQGTVLFEGEGRKFYQQAKPCFVWQSFYRKAFLDAHGIRFGAINYAEDIAFNLDLFMLNPRFMAVSSNVYRYTVSEGQLTRARGSEAMHKAVNDLISLMGMMQTYAEVYQDMRQTLDEYKECLMLSCARRMLSADYTKDEWVSVKASLLQVKVLPMHILGKYAKVINLMMKYYAIYSVVGAFYRVLFIPYILPRMSRN